MLRAILARAADSAVARAGAFGAAYFAGAELGHALSFRDGARAFAALWPPAGLLLAALALSAPRRWGGLLAAGCVASLASSALHDTPLPVSLGLFLANALEATLGAWLLRRSLGPAITLGRLREVAGLALLGAALSPAVGATAGAVTTALTFGDVSFWVAWGRWWLADTVSALVVAPVVFTLASPHAMKLRAPGRLAEGAAAAGALVVAAFCVFGKALPPALQAPSVVLPILLWMGLRFGPRGAACAVLIVGVIGLWYVSRGQGPYAALSQGPGNRRSALRGARG